MSAKAPAGIVITCEHGGNRTPAAYAHLFAKARPVLATHRGYDPGALELARRLAKELGAPLYFSQVTRLLVDLNRSLGHPSLFSEFSRPLSIGERQEIIARHYSPYREQVEQAIAAAIERAGSVLHLSVHSFTPMLHGETRRADIGLLYDPKRSGERRLCDRWAKSLATARPDLVVRRNYPYRGAADGFTTYLRRRFPDRRYAGIELEVNQKWVGDRAAWRRIQDAIVVTGLPPFFAEA